MGFNDGNSAIFKPDSKSDRTTSLLRRDTAGDGGPLVLSLRKSASATRTRVGGKAANLGRMLAAGLPVPMGFCITTKAFEEFLALCPQHADLCALLQRRMNSRSTYQNINATEANNCSAAETWRSSG